MVQVVAESGARGDVLDEAPAYVRQPPIEAVVFGWGVAEDGQLGLDSVDNVLTPKVVESLLGTRFRGRAVQRAPLVAGSRCTLAIDHQGQVWSWGWNDRGTLGHGHRSRQMKPRVISALKGTQIVQAAAGGWHCLGLSKDGRVFAWGGNEYLQCGVCPGMRDIVTPTICVPHLQVWMWGEPWGDFSVNINREPTPVQGAKGILTISAGAFHNLALDRNGEVWSWGTNDFGQLGNGSTKYQTVPGKVLGLEEEVIGDVVAGGWHSAALSREGQVFTWGRGEYGRLGIADKAGSSRLRPAPIVGLEGHTVVQVTCGGSHTMCLTSEGRLFTCGRGNFGRQGTGKEQVLPSFMEVALPGGLERWKVISTHAGGRHSMCLAMPVHGISESGTGEQPAAVLDAIAAARGPFHISACAALSAVRAPPPPQSLPPSLPGAAQHGSIAASLPAPDPRPVPPLPITVIPSTMRPPPAVASPDSDVECLPAAAEALFDAHAPEPESEAGSKLTMEVSLEAPSATDLAGGRSESSMGRAVSFDLPLQDAAETWGHSGPSLLRPDSDEGEAQELRSSSVPSSLSGRTSSFPNLSRLKRLH